MMIYEQSSARLSSLLLADVMGIATPSFNCSLVFFSGLRPSLFPKKKNLTDPFKTYTRNLH
jgi:hypothetical protein